MFHLLLLYLAICQAHQFDENSFDSHLTLHPAFSLHWTVREKFLRLGFVVNTTAWFGFGFSSNGGMAGADIMMARATRAGQVDVTDHFAKERGVVPEEDRNTFVDWQVVIATIIANKMSVEVLREYDTKDPEDIPIIPGDMRVIWAISSVNELIHHDNRGSASVAFVPSNSTPTLPTSETISVVDILLPATPVSLNRSSCLCSNFILPADKSYHAVMFTPQINSSAVSSVLAYICQTFPSSSPSDTSSYVCEPQSMLECESIFYAWTLGGGNLVLPDVAGVPIGVGGITNVVLQVRYQRNSLAPVVDNSGFRLFYTANLRASDAGFLKLGSPQSQIQISGQSSHFAITNDCDVATPNELHVVANSFHLHFFGKQVWSAVYRDGKYWNLVGRDLFWDPLLPANHIFDPEVILWPSDRILTTCVYDTRGHTAQVSGGEGQLEEQCLNFLLVYPMPNITKCINEKYSFRREFERIFPWDPASSSESDSHSVETEAENFRRGVVIMNQVISGLSMIAALFMIACWFLFRDLRTFAFHLIFMMATADFFNSLAALWGLPSEGSFCEFQAWMISFWALASILWTSGIAFTLHMAFLKQAEAFSPGRIESKRMPFHLVCWGIPFILTVLPAITRSYGQDYAFCWVSADGLPHVVWRYVQFYIPLWIAFAYNAFVYVQIFCKLRQRDSPPALLVRLTLYPLILVICWFPDTVANIIEASGGESPWFNAFALFFSGSNGLLNMLVYGLTEDIRMRLCCHSSNRTSASTNTVDQEPSVI